MSHEPILDLLNTITENGKTTLALIKDVDKVQKECYQELIKTYEEMIEQQKIITALLTEIVDLQDRIDKLEKREKSN